MKTYLIPVAIGFQALSALSFLFQRNLGAVGIFLIATAAEIILAWMDRKKVEEIDVLRAEMNELKLIVGNVTQTIGLSRF